MHPIILDNFTALLRAGAFNLKIESIEPMSAFKWAKLLDVAEKLDVKNYIEEGMHHYFSSDEMPVVISPKDSLRENNFDCSEACLYGPLSSRKFKKIYVDERHSMDTSVESLKLLSLIVQNANLIITSDLSLSGIIAVGEYLRKLGNKVDFVKLNQWIEKLGIIEVSSFIGALLVELFDFDSDEIEFMTRKYANPLTHYYRLIDHAVNEIHHFPTLSRLNIALIETTSYKVSNVLSRILNVEE